MTARIGNVTIDCTDVLKVASFWSAVLGRPLDPGSDEGYAAIGNADAARTQPAWCFEQVPEAKVAKNRMHVDLIDADPGAVQRLVSLGASVVATHEVQAHGWTVLRDPEGNEFCIAQQSYTG